MRLGAAARSPPQNSTPACSISRSGRGCRFFIQLLPSCSTPAQTKDLVSLPGALDRSVATRNRGAEAGPLGSELSTRASDTVPASDSSEWNVAPLSRMGRQLLCASWLHALALALALTLELAAGQATLTLDPAPTDGKLPGLEPNSLSVGWGNVAFSANDRVFVHLPGFGGGYNSFGTLGTASGSGIALPSNNGVQGTGVADAFASAEWDERTESLKVVVKAEQNAGTLTGLKIDKAFLPHGQGPVPPAGGIDARWYKMAYVRRFPAAACAGNSGSGRTGMGAEVCTGAATDVLFGTTNPTFSTRTAWLPTKPGLGAVGTFAKPTIVHAAAGYSSTGTGSANCVTVTLITSVTMGSPSASSSTKVTLTGLTGFSSYDSDVFPLFLDKTTCLANSAATATLPGGFERTAKFAKEAGKLTMALSAGHYLVAGQVATFSFRIRNGAAPSEANIQVEVDGVYCTKAGLCASGDTFSASSDVEVDFQTTRRSENTRRSIVTTGPSFDIRKAHQSTADPGQTATMTVTLKPNRTQRQGDKITLKGLCGTVANAATFSMTGPATINSWDGSTMILTTTVSMNADTVHVLTWNWKLLEVANSACDVTIQSSGSNPVPSQGMQNVGQTVGLVQAPGFVTHKIGQYTTRPGAQNYICITLQTNFDFKAGSSVAFSGFSGASSRDLTSAPIYKCPAADLAGAAAALESAGVLKSPSLKTDNAYDFIAEYPYTARMVVSSVGILRRQQYVFALAFTNPSEANDCQQIRLEANGDITETVTMQASATGRATVDGNSDGDGCALKTYAAGFLLAHISQSMFSGGAANTLTVSLKTNVELVGSSTGFTASLTISGLTGTSTRSGTYAPDALSVASAGNNNMPRFAKIKWVQEVGEMVFTMSPGACQTPVAGTSTTCIKAGFLYSFQFVLMNGDAQQAAVTANIFATHKSGFTTAKVTMATPTESEFKPLYIIPKDQVLYKFDIGQKVPAPSARNAICVTLASAKNVEPDVGQQSTSFTISGLTGFDTDSQGLSMLKTSDGKTALAAGDAAYNMFRSDKSADSSASFNRVKFKEEGTATLFLASTMMAKTYYAFCFHLTNPDSERKCSDNGIKIETRQDGKSSTVTMTQDKSTRITDYPVGSACAGYTSKRAFTLARIRSHTNVTGIEAYLIVELITNYELPALGFITISGLSGYRGVSGSSGSDVSVSRNGALVPSFFKTSKLQDGKFVLQLSEGKKMVSENSLADSTLIEQVYELTFRLRNGVSTQTAPRVYISASNGIQRMLMQSGRPEDTSSLGEQGGGSGGGSSQSLSGTAIGLVVGLLSAILLLAASAYYYASTKGWVKSPTGGWSLFTGLSKVQLSNEERLRVFYMRYNPGASKDVSAILKKYGTVSSLNMALQKRYGADLSSLQTPPPTAPKAASNGGRLASGISSSTQPTPAPAVATLQVPQPMPFIPAGIMGPIITTPSST